MKKYLILILIVVCIGCVPLVKGQEKGVTLIAHRGAKDIAPEHTLLAYEKAVELGADFIEIDLRTTSDEQLISFHDRTLERTTNGKGEIQQYTLKELNRLDAGSWFNEEFKGESIPTLEKIFDSFGKSTNYYIETRPVNEQLVMEEKLLQMIKDKGLLNHVIIQSYSSESLQKIKSLNGDIPLTQLIYPDDTLELSVDDMMNIKEYSFAVGVAGDKINKSIVDLIRNEDLQVHVWFDKESEKDNIDRILSYKPDGVFTDFLSDTNKLLNN